MLDLSALVWLLLIALAGYYWHRALLAKEQAFVAAQRHCKAMQVQLLDQSVYLRRLWWRRDERGHLCLWRAFYFEFTAIGNDRSMGRVIMLGGRVSEVQLEPHRVS
jgi:hypothetical protein